MSLKVLTAIWENPPCGGGDLLCLLAIADNANDAGYAWPALATIARKAVMSERGVQKCIRKLEKSGLIRVDYGGGRHNSNRYMITTNGIGDDANHKKGEQDTTNYVHPSEGENPEQSGVNPEQNTANDGCEGDENPEQRGRNPEQRGTKPRTPVHPNRKEPSLEPLEPPIDPPKPKRRRQADPISEDAVISDQMLAEARKAGIGDEEAQAQFDRFKNRALAQGAVYADWNAAWRNWLRSPYFKPITSGGHRDHSAQSQSEIAAADRLERELDVAARMRRPTPPHMP